MILFPYAGDTRGGSVHSSFLLIEELLRRGRPLLLAFHGDGFARDLAVSRRFPLIDLPALGTQSEGERKDRFRIGNLTAAMACRAAIVQHGARLIHVNDKRMLRTWAVPSRVSGRRLLAHWRSVYMPSWSIDMGLRLTSRIVCVSHYSRDGLPDWAKRKSEVVYNPFTTGGSAETRAEARRRIRAQAGIAPEAAVIGYFGALLDRKRPHVLLKLLQALPKTSDGRPVHGIVCGEPLEPRDAVYFAMLAKGEWHDRLTTPGFVGNVADWMTACDVMVAPAVDEPLARVGVEAQSAGLPAIVSADGGLKEVVEDGVSGFVLDPFDLPTWVEKVRLVLDDAMLRERLREGGFAAAAKLTVPRHADAIEAIYDRLLVAAGTNKETSAADSQVGPTPTPFSESR